MNKNHLHPEGRPYTKEEFIEKIKTDKDFAKRFAELGPIYGSQWRKWKTPWYHLANEEGYTPRWAGDVETEVDQIANAIHLLKTDPDSRRILVSAWNVGEIDQMVLPPCHYSFQFYTRELTVKERLFFVNKSNDEYNKALSDKEQYESIGLDFELAFTNKMNELNVPKRAISLLWNQRSVDVGLGWSFNVSSYSLLLMMVAKQVNMIPEEVICSLGDCHIYLNQIEGIEEQLTRTPYELPTVKISDRIVNDISEYTIEDFTLENYQCHPKIKMPLSN
jgi:thymidylate synthase